MIKEIKIATHKERVDRVLNFDNSQKACVTGFAKTDCIITIPEIHAFYCLCYSHTQVLYMSRQVTI